MRRSGPQSRLSLVLCSGMGADARLLHKQREAFPDLHVPAWLEPESPREPLRHYAERLAATVRADGPLVVGGVSLGGMIALEMARHIGAEMVVLIGSCRDPSSVGWPLRFGHAFLPLTDTLVRLNKGLAPVLLGGCSLSREDRAVIAAMASDAPVPFLRWGAYAVMSWPGCEHPGVPVRHIHGGSDWIIPAANVRADEVVRGAPHVVNMTHAPEVNAFMGRALDDASGLGPPTGPSATSPPPISPAPSPSAA